MDRDFVYIHNQGPQFKPPHKSAIAPHPLASPPATAFKQLMYLGTYLITHELITLGKDETNSPNHYQLTALNMLLDGNGYMKIWWCVSCITYVYTTYESAITHCNLTKLAHFLAFSSSELYETKTPSCLEITRSDFVIYMSASFLFA